MEIDVQPLSGTPDATCVSIDGRIDNYTVDRVEEELNSLVRIGSSNLICDLSAVEFVSSSGFKAFRRIIGFAREQEGDLKFCGLSAELMLLFNSVGFGRETGIFSSRDEALFAFDSASQESDSPDESGSGIIGKFAGLLNSVGLSKETDDSASQKETRVGFRKTDQSMQQTQILPKNSALKKTVVFSRSDTTATARDSVRFALIEPVKITLYPEASHFQNVSQLLGTTGSLVGFPSEGLVKLNVAVLELCRIVVNELNSDETFSIEIDSRSPGFRVYLDIPREKFNIYGHIQPKTADEPLSEQDGREWLLNYVDEVESESSGKATRYQLSLHD